MKRFISLSLVTTAVLLNASEVTSLDTISVVETANSKIVKDVSDEQIKSADLAEALSKNVPSISIVRRSGIANDIILRGQKKIILISYLMMLKSTELVQIEWILQLLMY